MRFVKTRTSIDVELHALRNYGHEYTMSLTKEAVGQQLMPASPVGAAEIHGILPPSQGFAFSFPSPWATLAPDGAALAHGCYLSWLRRCIDGAYASILFQFGAVVADELLHVLLARQLQLVL